MEKKCWLFVRSYNHLIKSCYDIVYMLYLVMANKFKS